MQIDNYEDVQELLQQDNISVMVNYRPGTGLIGTLKNHAKAVLKTEFYNIMIEDFSINNVNTGKNSKIADKQLSLVDEEGLRQVKALKSGTDYLLAVQGLEHMTEAGQKQFLKEVEKLQKQAPVKVVYAVGNPNNIADIFFDKCENCYRGYNVKAPAKETASQSSMDNYPDFLKARFSSAIAQIREESHDNDKESGNSNKPN